ncbi:hypothetical protein ABGB09_32190 [Streptomyces sp. B8F3]
MFTGTVRHGVRAGTRRVSSVSARRWAAADSRSRTCRVPGAEQPPGR